VLQRRREGKQTAEYTPQRFGKAEEAGGLPGGRGSTRWRRRQQPGAAADGGWGCILEAEQVRTVDSCSNDMRRADDAGAAPRQVRTCGDAGPAPRHGRPAGGLEQRSSQAASRARGSPAACYLPLPSPALTVNASRGRFPARGAYFGRRAVDFPRLLLFAQACVRFRARQLSFWRPSAAIHSASAAQL